MFVLRSAFWLTVAFFVVAPHGTDFGATANSLKDQAIAASIDAGQQLIVSEINLAAKRSIFPDVGQSLERAATELRATPPVFPRPRPAALS